MSRSMQIILCAMPYVVSVFFLIGYVMPAWDTSNRVNGELKTMQSEFARLSAKLKEKEALIEQKRKLDKDIQRMRSAVPQRPDMDVLLLDMERLSNDSGTELIAIEAPNEKKKDKDESIVDSIIAEVGGRMSMAPKSNRTGAPAKPVQPAVQQEESRDNPLGIKQIERRVYVTGSYRDLMQFLKRLEAYQRIVGIRSLIVSLPEDSEKDVLKTLAGDKGRTLELDQPVMTFLMSIYYLP